MKPAPSASGTYRAYEKKQPQTHTNSGDFQLTKNPKTKNFQPRKFTMQKLFAACTIILVTIGLMIFASSIEATQGFTMIILTALALCGLVSWDISSRHFWEKDINEKIDRLITRHDRLVHKIAGNRNDVFQLKEELGIMAKQLTEQGEALPPSSSPEAEMIGTIIHHLSNFSTAPNKAIASAAHNEDILELSIAPPSKKQRIFQQELETNESNIEYSETHLKEFLHLAIENESAMLFMQPVVSLPQRRIKMMEIYARISDGKGNFIPAAQYLKTARQQDVIIPLDNQILIKSLETLASFRMENNDASYILNISAHSLHDRGFMNDLASFLSRNNKMAGRVILELAQHEFDAHSGALAPIMQGLSRLGVRFSIDTVRNKRLNISTMKSCAIRFLKMDAEWVLTEGHSSEGFSRITRLKKQLDAAGITLIIEHIETESILRELLDYNADYGQGYLFGKPDLSAAYKEKLAA